MNYFLELETRDVELIIELLKKNTMIPMEVSYPLYSKIMQSVENTNNEYKKQQLEKQQTIENEKLKQLENDDKETNKMKNEKRTIRMRNKKISKGSDNDLN